MIKQIKNNSTHRSLLSPLIIWIGCALLFIIALATQNETLVYFNLFIVLIGIVSFLWFLYEFGQGQGVIKTFFMALLMIILFSIVFLISFNPEIVSNIKSIFKNNVNKENELIECYVEGRQIMTTRADCQELSIPKQQPTQAPIIIQQQQPVPQIKPIQFNRIKTTNCYWYGNSLHCTEY